ncbi:MAG: serine protease [Desulfobacterales bacterium]|nr:serine protease [Desulfobacterales bacterium]
MVPRKIILFSMGLLLGLLSTVHAQSLYVVPVKGPVEPGMAAFVKRSINTALEADPHAVFVFQLDTFGGRVDSALDIVDAISQIPRGRTVSYVEKRAISAGALIALSGSVLVMKDSSLIGDCAPIIQTQEGQKEVGEKTQTVLRAQFRALAKRNNYPELLAQSMVTKSMKVMRVTLDGKTQYMDGTGWADLTKEEKKRVTEKKTIVDVGELLTMDDVEARTLGFSRKSTPDLDQALAFLGYADYERHNFNESWSESLVRWLQPLLPILMIIGLGALYMEIKAPGFGFPGIIGVICLGIVFFNQHLVGLAQATELLLLVLGGLLIIAELFVFPGFGISGITGILVMALALILAFQGFVIPDPELPWEGQLMMHNAAMVLGSFLAALVLALAGVRYLLPAMGRVMPGPYLETTLKQARVESNQEERISENDTGLALTPLRPAGKIQIKGEKYDAQTRGEFIEAGTPIQVDALEQNHIFVTAQPQKDPKP